MAAVLRKVNARKAAFGFIGPVALETIEGLAQAKHDAQLSDPNVVIELNFNMSSRDFKIYTNDENTATMIEQKYCS